MSSIMFGEKIILHYKYNYAVTDASDKTKYDPPGIGIAGILIARRPTGTCLIAEQLFHLFSSQDFPVIDFVFRRDNAPREIKILAKIARCFVEDRIGASVATLVRGPQIVTHTIQTDAQINPAPMAAFASTGLACQRPFPAAFVAVACHQPQRNGFELD
jgi:hypothetical protein